MQRGRSSTWFDRAVSHQTAWPIAFTFSVIGFALCAHRQPWMVFQWTFLCIAGACLCGSWVTLADPMHLTIGLARLNRPVVRVAVVAAFGVLSAIGYRRLLEMSFLPHSLHPFSILAMSVGATEELIWRGWMQGVLNRKMRAAWAIIFVALSHTAYKTALFSVPPQGVAGHAVGSLALIAGLTFVFGALLGVFRYRQGTIGAPIAFHATFDLLVYGGYAVRPWWVF